MLRKDGMTLMEIIVVLIIVGIAAAFFFPNYTTPMEQSRAANAQNNLLAIYSAEQNYNSNNGYCLSTTSSASTCTTVSPNCADTLAAINCNLSLNTQDDGTYLYSCSSTGGSSPYYCTATRTNSSSNLVITVTLGTPIALGGVNPTCTSSTGNTNWCP